MTKKELLEKIEELVEYILTTEEDSYNDYLEENETGDGHVYDLALEIRSELPSLTDDDDDDDDGMEGAWCSECGCKN